MEKCDIIIAKLRPPGLKKGLISRRRLISKMTDFKKKKAAFIVAPAGYGKTAFARQFTYGLDMPFLWYQLDTFDNNPVQFFQYLISGLSMTVSGFQVSPDGFRCEAPGFNKMHYDLMLSIIRELENKVENGLVLILDDFHTIDRQEILKFIEYLLKYIPDNVHIMFLSRYEIDIQLLNLKLNCGITRINKEDLEFNQAETEELLGPLNHYKYINEESIAEFINSLNGWSLGLSVLKTVLNSFNNSRGNQIVLSAKNEIFRYIYYETYKDLPWEIQKFLAFTSVLEILTPDACNYMLDSQDAASILEHVCKTGLFLMEINSGSDIYHTYNQIYKEFLQNLLSEKRNEAFRKAGQYYIENGMFEQAASCFTSIDDSVMVDEVQKKSAMLFYAYDARVRENSFMVYNCIGSKLGAFPLKLFIRSMGSFSVYYYKDWEKPISWRTLKAKEIFAYLIHFNGQTVSTEKIITDIWPDSDIEKARDLFHTNLYILKKHLKDLGMEGSLKKNQAGYGIDTSHIICDLWLLQYKLDYYSDWEMGHKYFEHIHMGTYMEDIYSEWPSDKRVELELKLR